MSFNEEECQRLINALTNIHSANDSILSFVKKRAQQASAFGSKFLLSTMEGNTLDTLTDLTILYPNYPSKNNGAILFKIDEQHKIQIYQLENLANNIHNRSSVLFSKNASAPTTLRVLQLNGNQTIFIDTTINEELAKYYFIKGENGEVVTEGWNKKQKVPTRGTQEGFSHWTKFAGMMERYINPETNYHKFASKGGKNENGSDTPIGVYTNPPINMSVSFCTICGNPILNKTDVDHCWNLRFNKYLGVIDEAHGYFDTHPECNIKKSDKLYFPTDEAWNYLLECAGYDDGQKANYNLWKKKIIDNNDYPNFTLDADIRYNQEYLRLDIMDKNYLERLLKVDPKLTDYKLLEKAIKKDILIHVTTANIYMSLYDHFEKSFDLTEAEYEMFFNFFDKIEDELLKSVEQRVGEEDEISVKEQKQELNNLIDYMRNRLENYFKQKQKSDMISFRDEIVNGNCGNVIRFVSEYAAPLSPANSNKKGTLSWSEDSLDKFIRSKGEITNRHFSLSTKEKKFEYNSFRNQLETKIGMLKDAFKNFESMEKPADCKRIIDLIEKYQNYYTITIQIRLEKDLESQKIRRRSLQSALSGEELVSKGKAKRVETTKARQSGTKKKMLAERRKNRKSNKQKQGGRKTRKKKRRRKKKTRRKRRRKKKKRTRRKK